MKSLSDQVQDELKKQLSREVSTKVMRGYNASQRSTPVDTGQMRASWVLTQSASYYPTKKRPKGHPHGLDIYAGRRARNEMRASLYMRNFDLFSTKIKTLFIDNSITYSSFVDGRNGITQKVLSALK